MKDKMIKITNKDRQASNNEIMNEIKPQNVIKENNENYYNDEMFGYDMEEIEKEEEEEEQGENESVKQQQPEEKKNFIMGIFSKFFSNDNNSNNNNKNNIIKKKQYHYKFKQIPMKLSNKKKDIQMRAAADYESCVPKESEDLDYGYENNYYCYGGFKDNYDEKDYNVGYSGYNAYTIDIKPNIEKEEEKKIIEVKPKFNFDGFIISQDIIEGNWTKDTQSDLLIEQENDMYEKIKKFCEDKGIKEENGIITLFALYHIYSKKSDKLRELKFVVKKAKNYLRKLFKIEYDVIIKDIQTK